MLVLLAIATLFAFGFVVVYAEFSPAGLPNELLGICLGMSLLFIGAALTVVAKRLVVTEELEDDYPRSTPSSRPKSPRSSTRAAAGSPASACCWAPARPPEARWGWRR